MMTDPLLGFSSTPLLNIRATLFLSGIILASSLGILLVIIFPSNVTRTDDQAPLYLKDVFESEDELCRQLGECRRYC